MYNRIAGILLLFVLFAPAASMYCRLHIQKAAVRHQVKKQLAAGMEPEKLVLLQFTKAETQTKLRWEHAGEFEFKGQMFDIVKTEIRGDTLRYWCWWDKKESALNRQLRAAGLQAVDPVRQENNKIEMLISFFKTLFCLDSPGSGKSPDDQAPAREFAFRAYRSALPPAPPKPPPNWRPATQSSSFSVIY